MEWHNGDPQRAELERLQEENRSLYREKALLQKEKETYQKRLLLLGAKYNHLSRPQR